MASVPVLHQCVPTMASVTIVATMYSNNGLVPIVASAFSTNYLSSQCCNNVFQQLPRIMLVARSLGDTQQRQTDMDGPIKYSSLMLERDEHIHLRLFA